MNGYDELIEDFLEKSFGPAIEPIREFYRLIDGATRDPHVPSRGLPLNDDRVGRMYRQLAEARRLADGIPDVLARIDDLILYLWTDNGVLPRFTFTAGRIYQSRGPLRWDLYDADGDGVDEGEIPPDREAHTVDLHVGEPGLYRLEVTNTGQGFAWDYTPRGARMSIRADDSHPLANMRYTRLYFYGA